MIEKVNPSHPDKIADRIAGALVDEAYRHEDNPKIAVEVLIGHGNCHIIAETSVNISPDTVRDVCSRISGIQNVDYVEIPQDPHLAENQKGAVRCGDNGIFRGAVLTEEQKTLSRIARKIYKARPYDGKYILDGDRLIVCQSNASDDFLRGVLQDEKYDITINPLGYWTGGTDVDTGATNRKLGSDMADAVTGGGLHGKDLSKADVSVNIYAHLMAQSYKKPYAFTVAIGDDKVNGLPYWMIVQIARSYIHNIGGFEKFAEWGLF